MYSIEGQVVKKLILCGFLAFLAACSGNPLGNEGTTTDPGTDPGTGGGIDSARDLPPGTASPSRNRNIVRFEPTEADGGNVGDGFVTNVRYNRDSDTFQVDNLGFDGDNVYTRGTLVGSLAGRFAVYEGKDIFSDNFSGVQSDINQFQHRAIYGVSDDGNVEFAIVRTGQYVDYGFGGFIYKRTGGVTLPREGNGFGDIVNNTDPNYRGQAAYTGRYAGLRDFQGRGGLEYGTGDMTMAIDFGDFNDGNAVQGRVYNRAIFDVNGVDITDELITALETDSNTTQDRLPEILFTVGPGVMDDNGEIVGEVTSNYLNGTGSISNFEEGNYYAVLSGDNASQVVGIIVVEGDDPRFTGVTTRETGGFILNRQ